MVLIPMTVMGLVSAVCSLAIIARHSSWDPAKRTPWRTCLVCLSLCDMGQVGARCEPNPTPSLYVLRFRPPSSHPTLAPSPRRRSASVTACSGPCGPAATYMHANYTRPFCRSSFSLSSASDARIYIARAYTHTMRARTLNTTRIRKLAHVRAHARARARARCVHHTLAYIHAHILIIEQSPPCVGLQMKPIGAKFVLLPKSYWFTTQYTNACQHLA